MGTDGASGPRKLKPFRPLHKSLSGLDEMKTFNGRERIDRMYKSPHWEKFREAFLSYNPYCYSCGVIASVVDHLEPHQGRYSLFWKQENFLPLCAKCHNYVTAKFDRHHKRGASIYPKMNWLNENRMRNGLAGRVVIKLVPIPKEGLEEIENEKRENSLQK